MRMLRTGVRAVGGLRGRGPAADRAGDGRGPAYSPPRPPSSIRLRPTPTSPGTGSRTGTTSCTRSSSAARGSASTPRGPTATSAASRAPRSSTSSGTPPRELRTSTPMTSWRRRRPRSASRSAPAAGTTTPPGRATGSMYAPLLPQRRPEDLPLQHDHPRPTAPCVDVGSSVPPAVVADQRQLRRLGEERDPPRQPRGVQRVPVRHRRRHHDEARQPSLEVPVQPGGEPRRHGVLRRSGWGCGKNTVLRGAEARELGDQHRVARERARHHELVRASTTGDTTTDVLLRPVQVRRQRRHRHGERALAGSGHRPEDRADVVQRGPRVDEAQARDLLAVPRGRLDERDLGVEQPAPPGLVVVGLPADAGGRARPRARARAAARGRGARRISSAACRVIVEDRLDRVAVRVGPVGREREPQREPAGPPREVVRVVARVPLGGRVQRVEVGGLLDVRGRAPSPGRGTGARRRRTARTATCADRR